MTTEQFNEEMERLRAIRTGNGPKIAKLAKIRYVTYMNAMKGYVSNPEILAAIVAATQSIHAEIKAV